MAKIVSFFILFAVASVATAAVPEPAPGWRMELVAESPQVNHPSVVCTAPDGRVFVAEDPMDIRVAANAMQGRIICLHPDGRRTVFADGLYAVFGMQYLEGKLYVLHNPKFSVFDDQGGAGVNRRELIEQTNPNPWALDWNDHVPANFKLAMDGYFYLAVGDKGLYGARGTDGREVNLSTGGVVRIRPDGTGLEIFSTGVRNILDVAINAEDEMFTYDNTDEHSWMGRVTHMVNGGFYGYPNDFIPQRPYTLWMMHDLGGGAACGTLCYNEDALPMEFHGNLFLADFGQRQVNRLIIERDGATYRVLKHEKLFPNPPPDFRPVGIAWSADGRSMYICDWQHRDVKEDVQVGRLWKLTWVGETRTEPKPGWFIPAAMGKAFDATDAQLTAVLSHPSRNVRMTAQLRLSDRAKTSDACRNALTAVLHNTNAPALARVHALWALDGARANAGSTSFINDSDPVVRRQAIRQAGSRRETSASAALTGLLGSAEGKDISLLTFYTATALGRIADTNAVPGLMDALDQPDLFARFAVFTALNRIGLAHPESWKTIAAGLSRENERVREGVGFALRETYDVALVLALADLAQSTNHTAAERRTALELLLPIHHRKPAWKGEWGAYHPALQPPPERTEEWEGTPVILAALRSRVTDRDPAVRHVALQGILSANDRTAAPILRQAFTNEDDAENRQLIVEAMGRLNDPDSSPLIINILNDTDAPEALTVAALTSAGQLGGNEIERAVRTRLMKAGQGVELLAAAINTASVLKLAEISPDLMRLSTNASASVRQAAMSAMVALDRDQALSALGRLVVQEDTAVRIDAVTALGRIRTDRSTELLVAAFAGGATRDAAIRELVKRPDVRAVPAYLAGLDSADSRLREAAQQAVQSLRREAWPAVESNLNNVSPAGLSLLKKIYRNDERAEQRFANVPDILEPREFLEYAVRENGDAEEGKRLFHNPAALGCALCHKVGDLGVSIGPDLTSVGSQFSRHELSESILYPSQSVREGYQAMIVETRDGEEYTGLFKGETGGDLLLLNTAGQLQRLPKDTIKTRRLSAFSLMPEGLQSSLTLEQFAGLISYLESLKSGVN